MRTPTWESSAGALAAFLNSTTQLFMADLYTFTLVGGGVVRWTSADVAVKVNGQTYTLGPAIKRGAIKLSVGISVDSLDVTLNADASVTVNGQPLLPFIANGGLDSARVSLDRAFSASPGSAWIGMLNLFAGRVSDTTVTRYEAILTVASASELLNVMIPSNVYQPGCLNTLFDGACLLNKASFAVTGTATSATDATRTAFSTALGQASGYFALGWAVGLTGPNAGVGRTIKAFSAGAIQTIQPWPNAVGIGDTFTVYPGCDKQQTTCGAKFSNLVHFRGQPWIPDASTVI